MKNMSVKLFSFFIGGSIGDQEPVFQNVCFKQEDVCSRASLLEGVLVIKNVSVKLFSFINGGSIGDQERVCQTLQFFNGGSIGEEGLVCQTLQFLQCRQYW